MRSAAIFNIQPMQSKMMLPIELTKILYSSWEGQISISSQDSEIYGKCLNGSGNVTFKNGNQYQGNFYNGLLSGKGKFTWSNGIIYEGDFTDNRISGRGLYRWPDGSTYEGETKDGLRHGMGRYTIDEATYDGEWAQGKKCGNGKIVFKSGSIFEGKFKDDMKEGYGKMYYYPSGNYFEGQWSRDVKQGHGTMNWCDIREKYVGEWKDNHQHGWGIHVWLESKGEGKFMRNRYEGNWAKGLRSGFGVFYYANGSKYQGFWLDNMKEGYAFYTNQNGMVSLILFNKDRMIKNKPLLEAEHKKPDETAVKAEDSKRSKKDSKEEEATKPKKEVEPNYYSLCLSIEHFYLPGTPNLEQSYNFLLRNNTQLKSWYKGASLFYDQQSEFSFCLNLEGAWKMIRSLKILGDFSLSGFNRGIQECRPDIERLLQLIEKNGQDKVNYEDMYYLSLARRISGKEETIIKSHKQSEKNLKEHLNASAPFKPNNIHERQKNILFRQFVQLLVWLAFNLEPDSDKPHKSIQKLLLTITPFLDTISKASKAAGNDNVSENKSSISKADKNISPFYRNINSHLHQKLEPSTGMSIGKIDRTVSIRKIIGLGRLNGCIGEVEYQLLEKILEKYFDNEVLNREKPPHWGNSTVPLKILNVLSYELIEFEFIEVIYILFVKKLPSTKETDENKKKYEEQIKFLYESKESADKLQQSRRVFVEECRYNVSEKDKLKQKLKVKRSQLEVLRAKREEKQREREQERVEMNLMSRQDMDIKDVEFDEEQSEFEI